MIPLGDIRAAAARLAGHVHRTPMLSSSQLGERAGVRAWLKCESFQKTGSFKARGALNKVLSLSDAERARGLVTVSAGNHAAAVAWAARAAGCSAVVVMPPDAPRSKIEAVTGYGAEIVFHADRPTLFDKLHEVRDARGLTFVHPFDDPVVLAGAGASHRPSGRQGRTPGSWRWSSRPDRDSARRSRLENRFRCRGPRRSPTG
jgi:threonine dehydratase